MTEISDTLKAAFSDAKSDDSLTRIVAWGRITRAGLATSYVVGGRFVHLSLTEEGRRMRNELESEQA